MRLKPTFNRSEPGIWISGAAHAAMLGAAIFAFSSPTFPEAQEGIAVEVITDNQFSQITKGEETAKQVQAAPKPRVDRVADTRQLRDPGEAPKDTPAPPRRPPEMKVDDREVEAAAPPPPPRPDAREEAKREEAARAAKAAAEAREKAAEAKAQAEREERKTAEAKAEREAKEKAEAEAIEQAKAEARRVAEAKAKAAAEAKAREVAEAKAKAEAEAKAREAAEAKAKAEAEAKAVAEAKAKAEAEAKAKAVAAAKAKAEAGAKKLAEAEAKAKRQAELADKFNAGDIRQLLQSREKAQSSGATGSEVNKTASLGTATGNAPKLNPSMKDALGGIIREQIERCYMQPVGASAGNVTLPMLEIRFNADGTLLGEPRILRAGATSMDRAVAEAALRAVRRCAPYRIPDKFAPYYDAWKLWNVEFELGLT